MVVSTIEAEQTQANLGLLTTPMVSNSMRHQLAAQEMRAGRAPRMSLMARRRLRATRLTLV